MLIKDARKYELGPNPNPFLVPGEEEELTSSGYRYRKWTLNADEGLDVVSLGGGAAGAEAVVTGLRPRQAVAAGLGLRQAVAAGGLRPRQAAGGLRPRQAAGGLRPRPSSHQQDESQG